MSTRIHHLNCISTCPLGGALMDGHTVGLRGRLSCHCLLIETGKDLVLVDTGFGLNDVRSPRPRLSTFFLALVKPDFRENLTAVRQIQQLGFDPLDVRHIVLTHLDFDHAGGIDDFPHATVHLLGSEKSDAMAQVSWLDRQRYRPQQWRRHTLWREYERGIGSPWLGFDGVRELDGLGPDLLLIPLRGHTLGHAGVAVRSSGHWLLHAGDAYFYHAEMNLEAPRCTPGLRFYQWMMEKDRASRLLNQRRLRDLKRDHSDGVSIMSSHDMREFETCAHRDINLPIGAATA